MTPKTLGEAMTVSSAAADGGSRRRAKSPLAPRELAMFRRMLRQKRRELLGVMDDMEAEVGSVAAPRPLKASPGRAAGGPSDDEDRQGTEMTLGLLRNEVEAVKVAFQVPLRRV